jgi:predicted GH43/DUF377 family glycosyl hydrolase
MVQLARFDGNPILTADPGNPWEAHSVFNAAAVLKDDTFFLYYGGADTVLAVATCPMAAIRAWARGNG